MGWAEYAAALVAFLILHAVPVRPPVRPWIVSRLGAAGFTATYSAVSLLALAWVIGAAGRAPYVELWPPAPGLGLVPLAAMLPASVLVALALGRPNPFSFGGGDAGRFDPARPGVVRLHRHPLLLALALWAAAHAVPNGDLAHVILFGLFAAFAVLGMRMIDRRRRRTMGPAWLSLREATRSRPLSDALLPLRGTLIRAGAGVLLYLGLLILHPHLVGVAPLP